MTSIFSVGLTSFLLATTVLASENTEQLGDWQLSGRGEPAICASLDPVTREQLCGSDGILGAASLGMRLLPEGHWPKAERMQVFLEQRGSNRGLFMQSKMMHLLLIQKRR